MYTMPPPPCDPEMFRSGKSLLYVDTCHQGGNWILEEWIRALREASGPSIDWHYACGIASILFLGDREAIVRATDLIPLPHGLTIIRWPGVALTANSRDLR